jgi:hypothetical protein
MHERSQFSPSHKPHAALLHRSFIAMPAKL